MRILEVNALFPPEWWGGAEVYVYNLAKALIGDGHEVQVIAGRKKSTQVDVLPQLTYYDSVPVVRMPSFENPLKSEDECIEEAFSIALEEFRPDVVHFHNFFLNLPVSLIEIAQENGLLVVQHLQDYWFMCPAGTLSYSPNEVCQGPEDGRKCTTCPGADFIQQKLLQRKTDQKFYHSISHRFPDSLKTIFPRSLKHFVKSMWSRIEIALPLLSDNTKGSDQTVLDYFQNRQAVISSHLDRCDLYLCPSRFVQQVYANWGLENQKLIVFPLGLDLSRFAGFRRVPSRAFRFGYVGSLSEHKGVHTVVKAFRQLEHADVLLNLWGNGSASFRKRLRYLAGEDRRVRFQGSLPNTGIAEAYSNIDALIVPSECPETYGLIIREAFATGVPVIATDIGAFPEAIDHSVNGFLFEPGNIQQLVSYMRKLSANQDIYRSLRRQLPQVKSIDEDAVQLEALFEKLRQKK